MSINHGIQTGESPTRIQAITQIGNTCVAIGTAPVNLATDPKVNEPILCFDEAEAFKYFGGGNNVEDYTLLEAINVFFKTYKTGPLVLINVLDPAKHKTAVTDEAVTLINKFAKIATKGIKLDATFKLKVGSDIKVKGTDYTVSFNSDGGIDIVGLTFDGACTISYEKLNPSAITKQDVIGGVDVATGKLTGISLINSVFTSIGRVPTIGIAPGFSHEPTVGLALTSAMQNINEIFKGIALTDIDSTTTTTYTAVGAWKNNNSYTEPEQFNLWPMVKIGKTKYHMSTLAAATIYKTDEKNEGIPKKSPSNEAIKITGLCLADGTSVNLTLSQANALNDQGVATGLNFIGGWKLWGNRTGCYPANHDIKDNMLPVKRMFLWDNVNFTLNFWNKVDNPGDKKLINLIVESYQDYYNGLTNLGHILGGKITFDESENPLTSLLAGKYRFDRKFSPPGVAELIVSYIEYDPEYMKTLFGGA